MSNNPNTNCLEGMKCPECGDFGPFSIAAEIIVEVSDDGTTDSGDHIWDGDSYCRCHKCDHVGTVITFTAKA